MIDSGRPSSRQLRTLRWAALAYALGLTLHTADHFRRGVDATTPAIVLLGTFGLVVGAIAIVLSLLGHLRAPLAAAVVGVPKAVAVSAVHLLPTWSATFSDSFVSGGVDGWTWAAGLTEIGGLLALGTAGLAALRVSSGLPTPRRA